MIKKLTDGNFTQELGRTKGVVVLDFNAPWCDPCVTVGRLLAAVSEEVGNDAAIYELDVEESPDAADHFNVRSLPTVVVLRDGQEMSRLVGLRSKKIYLESIQALKLA